MINQAVIISDLHCGSSVALMPPKFKTHNGQTLHQNAVQEWLWDCWLDAWQDFIPGVVDYERAVLIVNGDLTEGVHHRTTEVVSNEPGDHRNMATHVLAPLAEQFAHTFVVEGTECHTGIMEHSIAASLGATPDPNTGRPAWDRLAITIHGCRCVFRHHIGTTSRPYLEASQLSIHLGVERQEAAINKEPIPQVLGCAHRHRYGEFKDASGLAFVTPPWQVLTRYGHKVVSAARCRPGLVVLDWSDCEEGELPETRTKTYRTPPRQEVVL